MFGKMPPIQGGVSKATWIAATDLVTAGHTVTFISNANSMGYGFRQMGSASSIDATVAGFAGKLEIRQLEARLTPASKTICTASCFLLAITRLADAKVIEWP